MNEEKWKKEQTLSSVSQWGRNTDFMTLLYIGQMLLKIYR